jgi:RNA polymerase sigma factor for flagellar operon FliA
LDASAARRLHLSELERIERILGFVCRRNGLTGDDAEEFRAEAHLHLIDQDYRVIRAFDRRSEFGTFLTTVLLRALQDFRTRRWGRWRPSAAARRAGEVGVLLETLVVRDRLSFDEAAKVMAQSHGVTTPRDELYELLGTFPIRYGRAGRRSLSLEDVDEPSSSSSPERALIEGELGAIEGKLREVLRDAVQSLPSDDKLTLKLVFLDGQKITDVARLLRLEAQPLYRRLRSLGAFLRNALESRGVSREAFSQLLEARPGLGGLDLREVFDVGPSNRTSPESRPQEPMGP